ncbi:beta-galactosidase 3 [Arachis duranensis]|uniref:Beta-galactosidase 3 n=1 Tax=Arachis duranensis TaxID=130453 RepID=A0A9C6WN21_ARADU|nr:beta-galactosidase 3 [Arachis duranensis]
MLYYLARVYTTNTILKVYSNAPDGNEPLALDMERMGKGQPVGDDLESWQEEWVAVADSCQIDCSRKKGQDLEGFIYC